MRARASRVMPPASLQDHELRLRAASVLPNLTHLSTQHYPPHYSQFFRSGEGCRITDVNGREFIDYMCSFGPILLGHKHPAVEAAAAAQHELGDCLPGPSERMVELAELLVELTPFADWAMFQKNGSDATTLCVRLARMHTRKRYILRAPGSYHGASHLWMAGSGVLSEEQAFQLHFEFNDLGSVQKAVEQAGDDLAAIVVSAFRWDFFHDLALPTQEFAEGLRQICNFNGAILILDDVRSCMRLDPRGSWNTLAPGVMPDLAAYCKGIANGYPLAAVLGCEKLRTVATRVPATGSFWCSAVPMAAALATIKTAVAEDVVGSMVPSGQRLRDGLRLQAAKHGLKVSCSGPVQMPLLTFEADRKAKPDGAGRNFDEWPRVALWCSECARRGVWFHPYHNNFLSAAHTFAVVDETLVVTYEAFRAVSERFGRDDVVLESSKL